MNRRCWRVGLDPTGEVVPAKVLVDGIGGREDVPGRREDGVANGDRGSFLAAAASNLPHCAARARRADQGPLSTTLEGSVRMTERVRLAVFRSDLSRLRCLRRPQLRFRPCSAVSLARQLALSIMLGIVACSTGRTSAHPLPRQLGQPARQTNGFVVAVRTYDPAFDPFLPSDRNPNPLTRDLGKSFSAIEVTACAPAVLPQGAEPADEALDLQGFALQLAGDERERHLVPSQEAFQFEKGAPEDELNERKLPTVSEFTLEPGACDTGWVTFEMPTGAKPIAVLYTPDRSARHTAFRWTIEDHATPG